MKYAPTEQEPVKDLLRWLALGIVVVVAVAVALVGLAWAEEPAPETAPLPEIMYGLAVDLDAVHAGLWTEDFGRIARAATAIAEHPKVPPEEMGRIQGVLGDDFAAFAQSDRHVHDTAVQLAEAARAEDLGAVMEHLHTLDQGCVACHTAFRDRLQDR